jgi:hypothetical protein
MPEQFHHANAELQILSRHFCVRRGQYRSTIRRTSIVSKALPFPEKTFPDVPIEPSAVLQHIIVEVLR